MMRTTTMVGMGKTTANMMGVTIRTRKIKVRARMVGMGRTTTKTMGVTMGMMMRVRMMGIKKDNNKQLQ